MSGNQIGLLVSVAVVIGILAFSHDGLRPASAPVELPEIVVDPEVTPLPTPAPMPEAVSPESVVGPLPVPAPGAPKKIGPKVVPVVPPVYHKVLPGGKIGPKIDCARVPAVAWLYPQAAVEQYARSYGLTESQIRQLRVCLN